MKAPEVLLNDSLSDTASFQVGAVPGFATKRVLTADQKPIKKAKQSQHQSTEQPRVPFSESSCLPMAESTKPYASCTVDRESCHLKPGVQDARY